MQEALAGRNRVHRVDEPALFVPRQQYQRDAADDGADAALAMLRYQGRQLAGVALDYQRAWQDSTQVIRHIRHDFDDDQPVRRNATGQQSP